MKQFWVDVRPWNKEIATTAIESGADALVVDRAEDVRRLGRITTVAPDGDIKPGKDVMEITITDKAEREQGGRTGKAHPRHRGDQRLDGHPAREPGGAVRHRSSRR